MSPEPSARLAKRSRMLPDASTTLARPSGASSEGSATLAKPSGAAREATARLAEAPRTPRERTHTLVESSETVPEASAAQGRARRRSPRSAMRRARRRLIQAASWAGAGCSGSRRWWQTAGHNARLLLRRSRRALSLRRGAPPGDRGSSRPSVPWVSLILPLCVEIAGVGEKKERNARNGETRRVGRDREHRSRDHKKRYVMLSRADKLDNRRRPQ